MLSGWGGELRADAGSVGGGWRGAVRAAPEPECLRFVWGASGSAAENRRRGPCPACSLSPHLLSQPSWLPISPPQPAASLICPPTRPPGAGSRASVVPGKQRGRAPAPSGSLLSTTRVAAAVGRDCGRGVVLGGCYSGGGQIRTLPLWARLGRVRAATGEAWVPAAPRRPPPACAPQQAATHGLQWRPASREGARPQTREGPRTGGGGARGRGPRHPGTFPPWGAGRPFPRQLRDAHVVADVTPAPQHTLHPD